MQSLTSHFGPFVLDRRRRMLTRNGEPVPIGHRGYILLETLLDASGEPVSKHVLMERAWPDTMIEEGNLTVQISALRRQLGDGADAVIVTVPRVGYRLVAQPERSEPDRGGPPLIAVLPFANHGSTAEDGYFADGVVDDIITALSRFKTFAVVSRGSTFALRDKGVANARTAASELGVRYALEGSIRRMGDRLRVTAQLLDAASGAQLWGERYEGAIGDVFSFQDRITESVVGVIEPAVRKAEIQRARRKPAANLDAYDLFLKAWPLVHAPGPDGHLEAIALLDKSAALDPGFSLARAHAAWVYEKRISMRSPPLGNNDYENCIELARTALALGGDDPLVRAICGYVLYRVANDPSGLKALRQAVEENPNNVVILRLAAGGIGLHGDVDESYRCHARAYELSPGSPEVYQSLQGMGASEMLRGNYEAAIEWCLKSLATFNDWLFTYITLVACYVHLDRMDEAKAMLRRVRELSPNLTIKVIEDGAAREDAFAHAVIPGLRKAGLPER
jgi:pentatricopeptide repeat protein